MSFKPNSLTADQVANLADWQLLVAACHYGPLMGDARDLDYSYSIDDSGTIFCGDISLGGDIDTTNPMEALRCYAGIVWQDLARSVVLQAIKED